MNPTQEHRTGCTHKRLVLAILVYRIQRFDSVLCKFIYTSSRLQCHLVSDYDLDQSLMVSPNMPTLKTLFTETKRFGRGLVDRKHFKFLLAF